MVKIKLKNFMKHESLALELGEGITLIAGGNNAGKSTVIRALMVIMDGRITEKHIRHGAKECEIVLEAGGCVAKVKRDGAGVSYAFNDSGYIAKVGSKRFWEVFPDFPYKPFELAGGEIFLPYINPQKQVPVFGQGKLFEFFSSLFSLTNSVQNSVNESKETLNEAKSGAKLLSTLFEEKQRKLYALEEDFHAEEYAALLGLEALALELAADRIEADRIQKRVESLETEISGLVDYEAGKALLERVDIIAEAEKAVAVFEEKEADKGVIEIILNRAESFNAGMPERVKAAEDYAEKVVRYAAVKTELGIKERDIAKIKQGGVCPACGQEIINDKDGHMDDLSKEIEELKSELVRIAKDIESIKLSKGFQTREQLIAERDALAEDIRNLLQKEDDGF